MKHQAYKRIRDADLWRLFTRLYNEIVALEYPWEFHHIQITKGKIYWTAVIYIEDSES